MVSMHLAWSQNGHWCLWLHLSHSSKVCIIIISLAVRITGDSGWFWSRQGTGNGGVSADHPSTFQTALYSMDLVPGAWYLVNVGWVDGTSTLGTWKIEFIKMKSPGHWK